MIFSLHKNLTWEFTALPLMKQMVFCRWVCTVKCLPNGSVKHFKAHLVTKGYAHIYIYGVDYPETFPVARLNSLQIQL